MYPLGGPSPKKIWGGGEIFSQPLRVRGRGPIFFGNSPWKDVPKNGFKILAAPKGESKLDEIS